MFKKKYFSILVLFYLLFSSCSSVKQGLGLEKDVPNEFLVEKRDSLVLPPDYKILPPGNKEKKDLANQSNKSIDNIFNKNINNQKTTEEFLNNSSSDVEKEILKQIK